ncbi:MAG: 50S ribosomal protein L17 [Deltaproteobacteria bacterium]|nr:50S ribosomal protein L17 [Deltaproteobacteria bacterium]
MRHRKQRRKLGRSSAHRHALFSNLLAALVEHGRIRTTERKARELRSVAEKAVTRATSLGDALLKLPESLDTEQRAALVHAMRLTRRSMRREMVLHLFREVAPRFLGRPGGYTRMVKLGNRRGDGAPMAMIEFIEAEMPPREWDKPEPKKKARRSKKDEAPEAAAAK